MKKKLSKILICILVTLSFIMSTVAISKNIENAEIQESSYNRGHVTIYVDTSGIDSMQGFNDTEKALLKALLLAHIWANFNETVGAENVTVTNDPTQQQNANRTVRIKDETGVIRYTPFGLEFIEYFLGIWIEGDEVAVFLKNLYELDYEYFQDENGNWNITRLANSLGRTSAHEVGHSYCVGHNHRQENHSKMTAGELVSMENRSRDEWHFDNHTRDVLRRNWGRPPCYATLDYDREALTMNYWGPTTLPEDACEFASTDATFTYFGELAYFFEFGWLGEDTDNGELDGNSNFDFIYKSSMSYNPDIDAEVITFLKGHSEQVYFLLRGIPGGPWDGQWFLLEKANCDLYDFITTPVGDSVARKIDMIWDVNNDDITDVTVSLDLLSYGSMSNPYNGFTFEIAKPNTLPNAPAKPDGPTEGKPGTEYTYSFIADDPDGDQVYYWIDWGDDISWFGPKNGGDIVTATHTWEEKGTYEIKVKAMDIYFAESDWSETLKVTMPRNRAVSSPFLQFLEQYPILYQLLLRFLRL